MKGAGHMVDNGVIEGQGHNRFTRGALWVAIGALILGALLSAVWVLTDSQSDIIGKAFCTILLLTGFALTGVWDSGRVGKVQQWQTVLSISVWGVLLLVGAYKIWVEHVEDYGEWVRTVGLGERVAQFIFIAILARLAVLHTNLYLKAVERVKTVFNQIVGVITVGLVWCLLATTTTPIVFAFDVEDFYWRVVTAIAILAAVGTALVPLVNALTHPKPKLVAGNVNTGWPTYANSQIPLPALPDGSPDWKAYYTGVPTGQRPFTPPPSAPQVPPVISQTGETPER